MDKFSKMIPGLDKAQNLLRKTLYSEIDGVQKPLNYIQQASGKMIRPSLVLLSAALFSAGNESPEFCESDNPVEVAAAVELIHTASLIHDDIIDNAGIRRGLPSLHVVLGKKQAVKIGNFLLSKAFLLLQNNDNNGVLKLLNKTVSLMCEGESEQLEKSFDFNLTEHEYYNLNYKKTSNFLAVCCEAGARSIGIKNKRYLTSLNSYGENLGYAFQILDDILDFTASPQDLGKPVNNDFKQGTITLPLIYMLKKPPFRKVISLIEKREITSMYTIVKKFAIKSGAIKYSLLKAYEARDNAYNALENLPQSTYKARLKSILDKLTENADSSFSAETSEFILS